MKNKRFSILLMLGLFGCETKENQSTKFPISQPESNKTISDEDKFQTIEGLPLGNAGITLFDTSWQYANYSNQSVVLDTSNESAFQAFSLSNLACIDANKTLKNYINNKDYIDYSIPMMHAFDSTMLGRGAYKPQNIFLKDSLELVVFSCPRFEPEQNVSEYQYSYSTTCLVSYDSQGHEIDGMPIAYSAGRHVYEYTRLFYIDSNVIISTVDFFSDQEFRSVIEREKWQVLNDGYFVRYFDKQQGEFRNQREYGQIMNHTKDGKWIEMKPRQIKKKGFISNTFVEANYNNGKPHGKWYFYDLAYDYDTSAGSITEIKGSEKAGKLIYSEIYNEGELVSREFVE